MVDTAKGSRMFDPNIATIPTVPIAERVTWAPIRVVRSCHPRPVASSQPPISGRVITCRQNMISGKARPAWLASLTSA